jgi:hypothetical protein
MFENFRLELSNNSLITFTQGEKTMKAMKKLTAIVCAICISMIGAQAIAADGPQAKKQIKKRTQTTTMSGTQTGTQSQNQTRSSY